MRNIKLFESANNQYLLEEMKKVDEGVLEKYKIDKVEWYSIFKEFNLNPDNVYLDVSGIFSKMYYIGDYVATEIIPMIESLRSDLGGLPTVIKREESFKNMFDEKKYELVFFNEYNPMALHFFLKNYKKIEKEGLYSSFVTMYQSISYGFNKIPQEVFDEVFKYAPSNDKIIKVLTEDFKENSELGYSINVTEDTELIIYRSQGDKSMPLQKSYSWSLSLPFVKRYTEFNKGKIYEGKIKVKDIIDYCGGGEREVLAYFNKISDVKLKK